MGVFCFAFWVFLAMLGLLYLPVDFRIKLTVSAKEPTRISIRIVLNLEVVLKNIVLLTTVSLSLLIHEHGTLSVVGPPNFFTTCGFKT